ncbi:MAG: DUF302 domain-containing protein [Chitinispirillaceae bacterium]|nr:DUF302 domain-containing protein [Chitinispirillaceae bacterium]
MVILLFDAIIIIIGGFMQFYCTTITDRSFEDTITAVTAALQKEGFGVLTTIDIAAKLKEKIGVEMSRYTILGACNPPLAHKALSVENKIGVMLPCNIIVQETRDGKVEVSSIDPMASMAAVGNTALTNVAEEVSHKLKAVIGSL